MEINKTSIREVFINDEDTFIEEIFTSIEDPYCFLLAPMEYPGCEGCQEPYDDYCRCGTYNGEVIKNSNQEAAFYYNKIFKDQVRYNIINKKFVNDSGDGELVEFEKMKILMKLRALLAEHEPFIPQDIKVIAEWDYYGEILMGYKVDRDKETTKLKLLVRNFKKLYEI